MIHVPQVFVLEQKKYLYLGPGYDSGPASVVGIATGYELDGPGRDFPHLSRLALGPT